ncbi:conserved domain protein [Streptococcus infantis SK1076]|uniref:Conserved domain protein n=1 Tax=Streptococcus infantis SK1076 TaxID=1005705 RepID=F5W1C6_9STRE|nr:conserved domain protein [Streptococcus infantis SK1076]
MNRFKKSKYIIVLFVVVLVVSVFLVMTKSSAVVTKVGDGISLIDSVVQKPFQWLESTKSDLGNLTRAYNENETLKKDSIKWKKKRMKQTV